MRAWCPAVLSGKAYCLSDAGRKSIRSMFQSTDLDFFFSYKGSLDGLPKIGIEDITTVKNVCLVPKEHPLSGKEKKEIMI